MNLLSIDYVKSLKDRIGGVIGSIGCITSTIEKKQITLPKRFVVENNSPGDKVKKISIIDIRPGWPKPENG